VDLHHLLLAGRPAHLCENTQDPTRRRIVFSIALFLIAAAAPFLFRLTKSRRTFYAQIEYLCFHTASVEPRRCGVRARRSGNRRTPAATRAIGECAGLAPNRTLIRSGESADPRSTFPFVMRSDSCKGALVERLETRWRRGHCRVAARARP